MQNSDLEKLLEEAYHEGFYDGMKAESNGVYDVLNELPDIAWQKSETKKIVDRIDNKIKELNK